jgi:hypothetical protein
MANENNPPTVELLMVGDRQVPLKGYLCSPEDAKRFAAAFRRAFGRLPESARNTLLEYWARNAPAPEVLLPPGPAFWNGDGWAGSAAQGRVLLISAPICPHIPAEHLETFIAHECGHVLCFAVGEPIHTREKPSIRAEWLIWKLMAAWGFDQPGAELWSYRYVDILDGVAHVRVEPRDEAEQRQIIQTQREQHLRHLKDMRVPDQLRQWLQ